MCYHFDDVLKIGDVDFGNIFLDDMVIWKYFDFWHLIWNVDWWKTLRIRFDKIHGVNRVYVGTRYLELNGPKKHDAIFDRIRYLISQKSCISYVLSHNFARIKINSFHYFPWEKTLTLHNAIIHIQSVFNKDQNHYYYNIYSYHFAITRVVATIFFNSISMLRFIKTKLPKEELYDEKRQLKIWRVNVNNMVISKLVETKTVLSISLDI